MKRAILLRDSLESLNRDLALRSLRKIFSEKLLYAPCTDRITQAFVQQLLQGTCQGVLQTIFYRDLHRGNLHDLTWYLFLSLLGSLLSSQLAATDALRSFPPFPLFGASFWDNACMHTCMTCNVMQVTETAIRKM